MADLDPVHLRTFVAVAGLLGFSPAARRLGLSQSAVSRHVRALESEVGQPLLDRDTHSVRLTAAGEIFLGYARRILDLSAEAVEVLGAAGPRGRVRFGVSEDFALTRLPEFLRRFTAAYPGIDLEFTVELSVVLHRLLRTGELDAVLAMRIDDTAGGDAFASWTLFRDRQVWIGEPGFELDAEDPVPLILYPRPSLTRDAALDALVAAGRAHRTVASSGSLSGLRAAALGGLGVMPFAGSLIPDGLVELETDLPALPPITFVLMTRGAHVPAATRVLIDAMRADHHRATGRQ